MGSRLQALLPHCTAPLATIVLWPCVVSTLEFIQLGGREWSRGAQTLLSKQGSRHISHIIRNPDTSSLTVCLDSGNDPFIIVNENTGKCIKPLNDWIVAQDCDITEDMLWKWVSQHRLFHLQSQKCLGLDITKPTDSLRMFSCDSSAMLWWKCEHHSLYGAAQFQLALKGGHAIASRNLSDVWKKGSGEALCDQPYHGEYSRGTLTHLLLRLVHVALNLHNLQQIKLYTGKGRKPAFSSRQWAVTLSCPWEVGAICCVTVRPGEIRCLARGHTAILWHTGIWDLSRAWAYVLSMITFWIPEQRKR